MNSNDSRYHLSVALQRYQPIDEIDQLHTKDILAFVNENPECFERSNIAGHVTGSAWVVNETHTKVLLTHHKKLNKWLQLGGHADGNPDILAVALREAQEESGLEDIQPLSTEIFDLDVHFIPEINQESAHYHYDVRFVFQANSADKIKLSRESHEVKWVELNDLASLTSEESIFRMNRKWMTLKNLLTPTEKRPQIAG